MSLTSSLHAGSSIPQTFPTARHLPVPPSRENSRWRHSAARNRCGAKSHSWVDEARRVLRAVDLRAFGDLLDENWRLKASLTAGITNEWIDHWYRVAREAGAWGGNLLGAGEGGFLLVQAPVEPHEAVHRALADIRHVPLRFERNGRQIIFFH